MKTRISEPIYIYLYGCWYLPHFYNVPLLLLFPLPFVELMLLVSGLQEAAEPWSPSTF